MVLRNGNLFAIKSLAVRAEREKERMAKAQWVLGRTDFDRAYLKEQAPQAKYFAVNEILREPFYFYSDKNPYAEGPELELFSTLSDTVYKGFDLVLRTARHLRYYGIAFEWVIAGMAEDSPVRRFFEKETGIRSEDVSIRFVGDETAEQLCGELVTSDIYVHPSYVDNSPNSLCEAQLLGLPCVACEVGGVPSLIDEGVTGFLSPAGDAERMAMRIGWLRDSCLRKKMGQAARAVALCRHDKETILRDLMAAYNEILHA